MADTPLSLALFWIAVVAYLVALVLFVAYLPLRRRWVADLAVVAVMTGWPFHAASIVTRALEANHWPLGNMYEYSTAIAFVVMTTFIVLALRARMRLVGLPCTVLAVSLLGVAYMLYVPPGQLVPALHSYWLTIHVTAMATSSGLLTFSFLFAMFYLVRHWADQRLAAFAASRGDDGRRALTPGGTPVSVGGGAGGGSQTLAAARTVARVLPSAKSLDEWSYRFVMLGFPIWSFGVICGAIWGEHAWGRYWGWDPKETFAFITWVIFAIYLHARVTYGWREKRAAMITGVGFVAILFTLYAVNLWIAGLHSYARA
ncbi:MAG TPA: c-type cytochrome biogenesis protein CcsB [Candidatus Dormibacteraeota bacterium]|jgi:cytochrome c-type biogenesis protein CcsB|nr:c-type cytochrome biogenesis protein CcsB [Candidatus Dormibacteraeota bacterium]